MRTHRRGGRPLLLGVCLLAVPLAASAQEQGSIQLFSQTQLVGASPQRQTGEHTIEPDFGVIWFRPGTRAGQLRMEIHATRAGDQLQLGRSSVSVHRAPFGGALWTLDGGDISLPPGLTDTRFSNLSAPPLSFAGASATATAARWNLQVGGGRTTAWRNIFGSDTDILGQSLAFARAGYTVSPRVSFIGRASRVRTSDLEEFPVTIAASDEAGGGVRVLVTPSIHLVADGAWVKYRAAGTTTPVDDGSYLVGTHVLLARGWVQVNASRFSPGELPVLHAALQDREGLFAAGEYDVGSRVRLFGGWETVSTNLDPSGALASRPQRRAERGFGGVRMRVANRSTVSVRVEDGDRISKPVAGTLDETSSDTGELSADWQVSLGRTTAFARYARRENIDHSSTSATYTQQDASGQLYVNVSRRSQLFGSVMVTRQVSPSGNGNSFLQFSGGGQQQLFNEGLWLRVEGTASRNHDRLSDLFMPRNALTVGLNGQITPQTTVGFNVYVDRAPAGFAGNDEGWLTRSMLRVTHTIATGSASGAGRAGIASELRRGSGTITGIVFADWNGNGQMDSGEEQLAGIPLRLGTAVHVTTAHDGQFAFMNVGSGAQQVGLDLTALPVDFDPPEAAEVTLELSRGATRRVAFGLLPLGTVQGRVLHDANCNGLADAGEPAVDGAVLSLDEGQRSELAREGRFRFDSVRAGAHRLTLLKESLPEGAVITGDAERDVELRRDQPEASVTFLVQIEKRPEVRKVFPPRIGANRPAATPSPVVARAREASRAAAPAALPGTPAAKARRANLPSGPFTVQVAALNDPLRARHIVDDLQDAGFEAYLVEPPAADPDGPYRVRVGRYGSRVTAQRTAEELERRLGEKLWVTKGK
ncbi:MAG TPA: SPOR domain-containing protein [Vicinamibacterales bacterium]|nr:SPOR domain-containing protein [Vicinamibacterales bacterium]